MGNAKSTFFFSHNECSGINGLPFTLVVSHRPSCFHTMADNKLVNLTHGAIGSTLIHFCKWDSTDAGYLKTIRFYY